MKKKVIIIGGGFAGVELTKRIDMNYFDVTLIDRLNHHQFQPLFYQVATSQIEPASISFPLRYEFVQKHKFFDKKMQKSPTRKRVSPFVKGDLSGF